MTSAELIEKTSVIFSQKGEEKGKELGETCPYWINKEIYSAIKHEDAAQQMRLRQAYLKQCHELKIAYNPTSEKIQVSCHPYDNATGAVCNRDFMRVAEELKKEMVNLGFIKT